MHIGRRENKILVLCICYFMYVFCYGIVIKVTLFNNILFQVKTYVPELILAFVMFECAFQGKMHINRVSFLLIVYAVLVFAFNWLQYGLNEQSFYLVRDIYIPLFAFVFLMNAKISENGAEYFFARITPLLKMYLIFGLVLAIIEHIKGWEWTSSFYTGYTFYGQDPISKVKIVHNLGLLRAPSLSGNFATFGYYCLIADIIIRVKASSRWKKMVWDAITLICIVLATNKSAIVAFFVALILGSTSSIRNKSKRLNKLILACVIVIAGFSTILLLSENSDGSNYLTGLLLRFDVWNQLSEQVTWTEILFPYKQFTYGTGAEGVVGFWDNTYFYCLFTQGIVGSILWVLMLRKEYKRGMSVGDNNVKQAIYYMTILFLVLGLTVNVTQGRGFFSLYLVFLGIACAIHTDNTLYPYSSFGGNSMSRKRF